MLYLIKCSGNNFCKIGYSTNPKNRLNQLQTGSAFSVNLLASLEGTMEDERNLHKKFKNFKLKGEWFDYCTEIKEYFNVEDQIKMYPEILGVFMQMEQSEIRTFGYLLRYADGTKFDISKKIRNDIAENPGLNPMTIYNIVPKLVEKKLIFKHDSGLYQINPRYAFQGSSSDRKNELKTVLELHCKDC